MPAVPGRRDVSVTYLLGPHHNPVGRWMPCRHMSCYTCLSEWVKKSGTCPQCRGKVNKKTGIIRLFPPS